MVTPARCERPEFPGVSPHDLSPGVSCLTVMMIGDFIELSLPNLLYMKNLKLGIKCIPKILTI